MRTIDADELQERLHEEAKDCYNNQQYGVASGLAIAQRFVIDSKTVKSNSHIGEKVLNIMTSDYIVSKIIEILHSDITDSEAIEKIIKIVGEYD